MKDADEPRQLEPIVTEPGMAQDAIEPSVTEPTPECRRCRWWLNLPGYELTENQPADNFGECRRNPPQFVGDSVLGDWPLTEVGCWCGEFQVGPKATIQCESRDG